MNEIRGTALFANSTMVSLLLVFLKYKNQFVTHTNDLIIAGWWIQQTATGSVEFPIEPKLKQCGWSV